MDPHSNLEESVDTCEGKLPYVAFVLPKFSARHPPENASEISCPQTFLDKL